MRPSPRPFGRFTLVALGLAGGLLVLVAAINLVADPFKVWRPGTVEKLDAHKRMTCMRIVRGEQAHRGHWQAALVGASRTEIGFDPEHPAFSGLACVNLGLSGAKRREVLEVAEYTLAHNPRLQTLVVEMDPSYWWAPRDASAFSEYRQSRFDPARSAADHLLSNLWGGLSTERSAQTLGDWLGDRKKNPFSPLGLRVECSVYLRRSPAQRFDFATALGNDPSVRPAGGFDATDMGRVEALAALCQKRGIRLVWVVPPAHVHRLAADRLNGAAPAVRDYKRALAALAGKVNPSGAAPGFQAWDFMTLDAPNREPVAALGEMQWHWEPGHFKKELGDRLLTRLGGLETTGDDFGALLLPDSVEAHLARQDAALADHLRAHPELAANPPAGAGEKP